MKERRKITDTTFKAAKRELLTCLARFNNSGRTGDIVGKTLRSANKAALLKGRVYK